MTFIETLRYYHNVISDDSIEAMSPSRENPSALTRPVNGVLHQADILQVETDTTNVSSGKEYTPWDQFGVDEYVKRNYGNRVLSEDYFIIQTAIRGLRHSGIVPHSLNHVADVGAGPNFYPAMLIAPYIARNGSIDLVEYSSVNRAYAKTVINGSDSLGSLAGTWEKFEDAMVKQDNQWKGALQEARSKAKVVEGSIYELPKEEYDAVSSFFVPESITDDKQKFEYALLTLISSVKPGGFMMFAHMLGSSGYHAREGKFFPAVPVTVDDLNQIYSKFADVSVIKVSEPPEARKGYSGMAFVIGRRKTIV